MLGFDAYPDLAERLGDVLGGRARPRTCPVDRRTLLPISPVQRPAARRDVAVPGHAWVPDLSRGAAVGRARTPRSSSPRAATAAVRSARSRRSAARSSPAPDDVLGEAAWLVRAGVREVVLVSENSTSYGKDLPGGTRALVGLLPRWRRSPVSTGCGCPTCSPRSCARTCWTAIATTPGVAPYFDLSFQHASPAVLRRMRRFGSTAQFLDLCDRIRALAPEAGIRSNVIVGFPGETDDDVAELEAFLTAARLDAVGVFGYSDEDGTEAAGYDGKVPAEEVAARVSRIAALVDELMAQRAEDRVGTEVDGAGRAGRGRGLRVHRPGRAPGAGGGRRVRAGARVRAGSRRARPLRRHRHEVPTCRSRCVRCCPGGRLSWPERVRRTGSAP